MSAHAHGTKKKLNASTKSTRLFLLQHTHTQRREKQFRKKSLPENRAAEGKNNSKSTQVFLRGRKQRENLPN